MRTCEACGREFKANLSECSWCGFDNDSIERPESKASIRRSERHREWWDWRRQRHRKQNRE
jgi:rRNA maturation endonuclease Nob1